MRAERVRGQLCRSRGPKRRHARQQACRLHRPCGSHHCRTSTCIPASPWFTASCSATTSAWPCPGPISRSQLSRVSPSLRVACTATPAEQHHMSDAHARARTRVPAQLCSSTAECGIRPLTSSAAGQANSPCSPRRQPGAGARRELRGCSSCRCRPPPRRRRPWRRGGRQGGGGAGPPTPAAEAHGKPLQGRVCEGWAGSQAAVGRLQGRRHVPAFCGACDSLHWSASTGNACTRASHAP